MCNTHEPLEKYYHKSGVQEEAKDSDSRFISSENENKYWV